MLAKEAYALSREQWFGWKELQEEIVKSAREGRTHITLNRELPSAQCVALRLDGYFVQTIVSQTVIFWQGPF